MGDWYNPFSWDWSVDTSTDADRMNQQRQQQLNQQGGAASNFAGEAQRGFDSNGNELRQNAMYLRGLASGQNSISAEQLRQGLGQQLAQQQAMAASASPNNAAMAARNAAMNMGQASYGMSGQQAIAGLKERQDAQQALANLLLQQRQQNLQGFLGANQNAMTAYGAQAPQSAFTTGLMGGIGGLAGGLAARSDREAKRDIVADEDDAKKSRRIVENLKPYSFRYKDERDGRGDQYGVMAQDMEKAGLGHAVFDTPGGKMVHAGKAATSALALTAALAKRIDELEKRRG